MELLISDHSYRAESLPGLKKGEFSFCESISNPLLFVENPAPYQHQTQSCRSRGCRGCHGTSRFWQNSYTYLNLGADYTHHITTVPPPSGFSDLPTALHYTYQLHAADGCNNSKFRLYEKATYQRGVRNSRLGVKNGTFFLSSTIFLTIVRKNTFQQQPTAFIWIPIEFEKKFADEDPSGLKYIWSKTVDFFLLNLRNLFMCFQFI